MKTILKKFWIRLICGKTRKTGNYSVYWGKIDGENYIFEVGALRSLIVDILCPWGQWGSHPLREAIEKLDKVAKNSFVKQRERLQDEIDELADTVDEIDQHLSYASTSEGILEQAEALRKLGKLKAKIEKLDKQIRNLDNCEHKFKKDGLLMEECTKCSYRRQYQNL